MTIGSMLRAVEQNIEKSVILVSYISMAGIRQCGNAYVVLIEQGTRQ